MSLLHPSFPDAFARYAQAVARRYPWVHAYMPINEPLTTARFGGLYGFWHPHQRSETVFARLLLAQCLAIRAASKAIREENPAAQIIVNEDVGRTFSTPAMAAHAAALNERRFLTWDVLLGRVTRGHPMYELIATDPSNERLLSKLNEDPSAPDVLGIDHYVTSDRFLDDRVGLYPPSRRDPAVPFVDVEACRVPGIPVGSIARAIDDTWSRYGWPMILAEISLAGEPHHQVAWWREAWAAAEAARASRVDIRAVTAWAIFGSVDWHCLMVRRDDIYAPGAFDASQMPPHRLPVADAVKETSRRRRHLTNAGRYEIPAIDHQGWWIQPERFTFPA
jgi:dTDP-4-dehydrorhamnose reductase